MKKRPTLRTIAQESTGYVLLESTRAAIEKMAEEFARDMMKDPEYRKRMHEAATLAARAFAAALREDDEEPEGPPSSP